MRIGNLCGVALAVVCMIGASSARATTISVTNGDFEKQDGKSGAVTDWYESSVTTNDGIGQYYQDWLYKDTSTGWFGSNTTEVFGMSDQNGWIYQQIGTYTPGMQVQIAGDAILAKPVGEEFRPLSVELWTGGGSPGDTIGLDSIGATKVASTIFTAGDLGLVLGGGAQTAHWSTTLTPTGASGDALWLRLAVGTANGEAFLDNISASATVPEPTTIVLAVSGIIGLLAYAWRKRK